MMASNLKVKTPVGVAVTNNVYVHMAAAELVDRDFGL